MTVRRAWILAAVVAVTAGCSQRPVSPPIVMPSHADADVASASPSAAPSPSPAPVVTPAGYTFPVGGKPASYQRTHHDYPATDIFANCGTPVVAVTDGVVLEVSRVDRFDLAHPDNALKGGLFVSFKGDDGVRYYNAHFVQLAGGIDKGMRVRRGQEIGKVGHTGNASNVCHLHFGLSPLCTGEADWWIRRGVIWPWSYLDAWRAGQAKSPAAEIAKWQQDHGCPSEP
jgi:murein DD-endopeptidase MepM/ murein hydrolase activator NlpD